MVAYCHKLVAPTTMSLVPIIWLPVNLSDFFHLFNHSLNTNCTLSHKLHTSLLKQQQGHILLQEMFLLLCTVYIEKTTVIHFIDTVPSCTHCY